MTESRTNGDAREAAAAEAHEERRGKGPSRADLMKELDKLERALEEARSASDENLRSWQRASADFSNYKRRVDEERETVIRFSNAVLIGKLLSVLDDFDRALENVPPDTDDAWVEGVRLVERKLRGVLETEGVTPIEAAGLPFDPNVHEAVVHEETGDYPDNQVIDELQRGYRLHGRVLRPALVRVANNPKEH
ncbi:MAG TPA: nucleotide exchange factor GrpE [Candidatus Limnocylindria bacterium]|jgi:molecular chaperone GrpE|nr:nucleotide exchange factor GrpE [Candidatus Limnocylindria bacterium]